MNETKNEKKEKDGDPYDEVILKQKKKTQKDSEWIPSLLKKECLENEKCQRDNYNYVDRMCYNVVV